VRRDLRKDVAPPRVDDRALRERFYLLQALKIHKPLALLAQEPRVDGDVCQHRWPTHGSCA